MKKILVLTVIIVSVLFSTPYEDFSPSIYELQIIEADNWMMEINLLEDNFYSNEYFLIDTFMIKNKSDSAMVVNYTVYDSAFHDQGKILVVTQDDLSKPIEFDKENDIITLECFLEGEKFTNTVKLGTYPGSLLHNIDSNQSICYNMFAWEHYKSNTPTFGLDNTGETAIIYGKIFDSNGAAITNSFATLNKNIPPGLPVSCYLKALDENGNYQAEYDPRYYCFETFGIWDSSGFVKALDVDNVEIDLEPGDSIEVNFYSSMISIKPVIQSPISLNNYPHPASSYTWFFIDNTEVEASAMRVNVYALNGRKVDSFIPSAKHFRYDCTHLPQGSYVMSLQQGNEVLATKKLQILK